MRRPSPKTRIALMSAAVLAAALALAPAARGETQSYLIQLADLVAMPNDCGGGSRYSTCQPGSQPGFRFTDTLPEGSVVLSVTVELNHGVHCAEDDYVFEAQLNGAPAGIFSTAPWCSCAWRRATVVLSPPPSAYIVRGANTLLLANASGCQGLAPDSDLGHAYARVTVEYEPGGGGGGGGGCDLGPVLARIDALDAKIETAGYATTAGVGALHDATRGWVTMEHESTRERIAEEAEATRQVLTGDLLRYLVERDLAASEGGSRKMTASACLPEESGGRLELTISIVFETIEDFSLSGCDTSVAERDLQRGHDELANGDVPRACDWYAKAYDAARRSCP
jgi:hypothetical protein